MKVYITKYALTTGIQECEVSREPRSGSRDMVIVNWPEGLNGEAMFHGNDWHPSLEIAQAHAREMRDKKIRSLKKQIAKLEKTTF